MVFAYWILDKLYHLEADTSESSWGYGFRYGKMAIIAAIGHIGVQGEITRASIDSLADACIDNVKGVWLDFESSAKEKPENNDYMTDTYFDFDNYYKGKTVDTDVKAFFAGMTGGGIATA